VLVTDKIHAGVVAIADQTISGLHDFEDACMLTGYGWRVSDLWMPIWDVIVNDRFFERESGSAKA
jgi:Ser/Thr protein kinase RdoA (MazF antagonist)